MYDWIRRAYNFYAPVLLIIWLAFSGHWTWLLGAIGILLVIISNNIEALLKVAALGVDRGKNGD
jgi:hypothetical protein